MRELRSPAFLGALSSFRKASSRARSFVALGASTEGSFCNHDSNGSGKRHITKCLMSENNAPALVFYILIHFIAIPCKTTLNDQPVGFVKNVNIRRLAFLSLFELESHPYEFSFGTIQSCKTN